MVFLNIITKENLASLTKADNRWGNSVASVIRDKDGRLPVVIPNRYF